MSIPDEILEITRNPDHSRLEDFLTHYPYNETRKIAVLNIMEHFRPLLETGYYRMFKREILKNPSMNNFIDYGVWAFSMADIACEKVADINYTDGDSEQLLRNEIISTINSFNENN